MRFQYKLRSTDSSGSHSFQTIGFVDLSNTDDFTDWRQITGTVTVPSSAVDLRVYVEATDNFLDFEVDHAFLVDVEEVTVDDPEQLITNGNFEYGTIGWGDSHSFTLKTGDSPSGQIYAYMGSRTSTEHGFKQNIDLTKLDGSDLIEVSFWAKLTDETGSNSERQDLKGIVVCTTDSGADYLQTVTGCGVLADEWIRIGCSGKQSSCFSPIQPWTDTQVLPALETV